ncbi:MAG: exodeoxyribonuclease VII small subunit [Prevotella sp.]|nr:exodeoxyribonuclease VII small subunit [Prevotella sp.]
MIKYEDSIKEIEQIITRLSNGDTDIDDMSRNIKRAHELLKQCRDKLTHTEEEIASLIEQHET